MIRPDDTCPSVAVFDAWPVSPLGPTYLTTYTFDPFYFELQILPELLRREAHPIVVFADNGAGFAAARQSAGELRRLGRDYYLFGVNRQRGVFHPKIAYFRAQDVALVGSGNLTAPGWGGNLEVLDSLDGRTNSDATREVRRFFNQLLDECAGTLASRLYAGHGDPTGLPAGSVTTPSARFLHTLSGDLWSQVSDELELMAGGQLLLAAPFFDEDQYTVRRILELMRPAACRVAADGNAPHLDFPSLTCGRMRLSDKDERRLHAKLLHARADGWQLLMTGSANLTRAAWQGHNVEAVVLRMIDAASPDCPAFDPNQAFEPCDWSGYQPREPEVAPRQTPTNWDIKRATLADGRLVVECAPPPRDPRFHLVSGERRENVSMESGPEGAWFGPVADQPTTAAVIEVTDADGSCVRTVVHQLDILRHTPAHRRQIAALLAVGHGDVTHHDRIELVQLLVDLTLGSGPPPNPNNEASAQGTADHGPKELEDTREMGTSIGIQSALEITRRTSGIDAPKTDLGWLLRRIADAVAGRPLHSSMPTTTTSPVDEGDVSGDLTDDKQQKKAAAVLREQERALDAKILATTRELLRSDLIRTGEVKLRFAPAYDALLDILCSRLNRLRTQVDSDDHDVARSDRELARLTLDLLRTAWQVPIWSYGTTPGILCDGSLEIGAATRAASRAALAKLSGQAHTDASDFDADMAWSVLQGIDGRADVTSEDGARDTSRAAGDMPPDIDIAARLDEIRAHQVTAEAAYRALEPVRRLIRALEEAPASAPSPEELALVAELCTGPAPHPWRRNWVRMRRQFLEGQPWPIGELGANGACPICAARMPTGLSSQFRNRFAHVVCEHCSAIILPGPLFKCEERP